MLSIYATLIYSCISVTTFYKRYDLNVRFRLNLHLIMGKERTTSKELHLTAQSFH